MGSSLNVRITRVDAEVGRVRMDGTIMVTDLDVRMEVVGEAANLSEVQKEIEQRLSVPSYAGYGALVREKDWQAAIDDFREQMWLLDPEGDSGVTVKDAYQILDDVLGERGLLEKEKPHVEDAGSEHVVRGDGTHGTAESG